MMSCSSFKCNTLYFNVNDIAYQKNVILFALLDEGAATNLWLFILCCSFIILSEKKTNSEQFIFGGKRIFFHFFHTFSGLSISSEYIKCIHSSPQYVFDLNSSHPCLTPLSMQVNLWFFGVCLRNI